MPQVESLTLRQPAGAVAADRAAADDLALLRYMLWSQFSCSQPELTMKDRLLFTDFVMEAMETNPLLILEPARQHLEDRSAYPRIGQIEPWHIGGTTVGLIRGGSVLSLVWSRFIFAFRSWVVEAIRRWQESSPERQRLPGPQPFLSSPAFLVAEVRWQWHLMVGQPITLAAATAACLWAWLGPVDEIITGTLILAAFAGILWLLPFQASPGTPWRLRFSRFIGLPTLYVAFDAALNVFFNALGQADWLRTLLLSALLVASLSNVVVVLASWRFVPVEVSLRQFTSGLRAVANKVDSLLEPKESSSAKDVEPPAPGL